MTDALPYRRKEVIGDCTLYLGDCRDILLTLGKVDAVVTDPPYGIGESAGKAKTRTSGLTSKRRNPQLYRRDYGDKDWDNKPIDDALLEQIIGFGRWQIIFGGNYYNLPKTKCWLVWDKLNGDTDFADCELAWTNLPKAVRRIQYLWNGCMRAGGETRGDHPTQKPVGVMKWCLNHLPVDVVTVCDPFMGSGTTGVAAVKTGKKFIGIERDEDYFAAACRRIQKAIEEPDMFIPQPAEKPKQGSML